MKLLNCVWAGVGSGPGFFRDEHRFHAEFNWAEFCRGPYHLGAEMRRAHLNDVRDALLHLPMKRLDALRQFARHD